MIKRKERENPEFNTTALPDIIFMLLFFFMVVTVMKEDTDTLQVDIPKIGHAENIKRHDTFLNMAIVNNDTDQNFYYLEGKKYLTAEDFTNAIDDFINNNEQKNELKAKIVCDQDVKMKEINMIKRCLQKNMLYKVEYITKKK